jgi:hypothetical protein
VIVADRLIAGAMAQVLAGSGANFDSTATHSLPYLEAIIDAAGDWEGLVDAARRCGAELAATMERIGPAQAASVVQTHSYDADGNAIDRAIELAELVTAAVSDHLPGHIQQLESYAAARA